MRVEVLGGVERRRRWSRDDKMRIIEETLAPGAVVTGARCSEPTMIPIPCGVRVWISTGHTDMRRGMQGLALTVQESLKRDPHAGDLYIFRGRRGDLVKILWHDGIGLSLYAKRLD